MLTYKALIGLVPDYLMELRVEYQPVRSLRSSQHFSLIVPRTMQRSFGDWAFSTGAPKLWNNLPVEVKETTGLEIFKSTIKTFLFYQAFSDQACLCDNTEMTFYLFIYLFENGFQSESFEILMSSQLRRLWVVVSCALGRRRSCRDLGMRLRSILYINITLVLSRLH